MNDSIQPLSDEQLEGIVGGAGLPAEVSRYASKNGSVKVYTETATSKGHRSISGDQLGAYLDRLESRGITQIGLYPGGGDKMEMHSIAEVKSWLK